MAVIENCSLKHFEANWGHKVKERRDPRQKFILLRRGQSFSSQIKCIRLVKGHPHLRTSADLNIKRQQNTALRRCGTLATHEMEETL